MAIRIMTARERLGVTSASDYRDKHASALERKPRRDGRSIRPLPSRLERIAYVNHNRWLVDCVCGAGAMTGPALRVACCGECGLVYESIVFPEQAAEIDAVLEERPDLSTRNWQPGESAQQLIAENIAHGVRKVED